MIPRCCSTQRCMCSTQSTRWTLQTFLLGTGCRRSGSLLLKRCLRFQVDMARSSRTMCLVVDRMYQACTSHSLLRQGSQYMSLADIGDMLKRHAMACKFRSDTNCRTGSRWGSC